MTLDLFSIFITSLLVSNFVLTQFLGLCPFVGTSSSLSVAVGMASATTCVTTLAAACGFIIGHYLLIPLNTEYLLPFFSIITIAILVQVIELLFKITSPLLLRALGVFLPLITSNCAVLGVALLVTRKQETLLGATIDGLGAGAGFSLVLIVFAAMREKLALCDVPKLLAKAPITIFSIAISSLAFMGYCGHMILFVISMSYL